MLRFRKSNDYITTKTSTKVYGKSMERANARIKSLEEGIYNSTLSAKTSELFGPDKATLESVLDIPELTKQLLRSYGDDSAIMGATLLGVFIGYFWSRGDLLTMSICGIAGNSIACRSDIIGAVGRIAGGLIHSAFKDLQRRNLLNLTKLFDRSNRDSDVSSDSKDSNTNDASSEPHVTVLEAKPAKAQDLESIKTTLEKSYSMSYFAQSSAMAARRAQSSSISFMPSTPSDIYLPKRDDTPLEVTKAVILSESLEIQEIVASSPEQETISDESIQSSIDSSLPIDTSYSPTALLETVDESAQEIIATDSNSNSMFMKESNSVDDWIGVDSMPDTIEAVVPVSLYQPEEEIILSNSVTYASIGEYQPTVLSESMAEAEPVATEDTSASSESAIASISNIDFDSQMKEGSEVPTETVESNVQVAVVNESDENMFEQAQLRQRQAEAARSLDEDLWSTWGKDIQWNRVRRGSDIYSELQRSTGVAGHLSSKPSSARSTASTRNSARAVTIDSVSPPIRQRLPTLVEAEKSSEKVVTAVSAEPSKPTFSPLKVFASLSKQLPLARGAADLLKEATVSNTDASVNIQPVEVSIMKQRSAYSRLSTSTSSSTSTSASSTSNDSSSSIKYLSKRAKSSRYTASAMSSTASPNRSQEWFKAASRRIDEGVAKRRSW